METPRRARSDAQKQQRRQAILDAAWQLYRSTSYDAITIANVAAQVGLAKGTIYLYFKTKEELFLALQEQQLADWFSMLDGQLSAADSTLSALELAEMIVSTIVERHDFTRLLAILHPIIEQNIDVETARSFKLFLAGRLATTGNQIERRMPALQTDIGSQLLLWAYALLIGFRHLSDSPPSVRAALADPSLAAMNVEFEPSFQAALAAMIAGALQKENR